MSRRPAGYRPQWRDRVAHEGREYSVWHVHDGWVDLVDTGDWSVTQAITVPAVDVTFLWRPPPEPARGKKKGPTPAP